MNQRHLDFRLDKPIVYTAGDFYHLYCEVTKRV